MSPDTVAGEFAVDVAALLSPAIQNPRWPTSSGLAFRNVGSPAILPARGRTPPGPADGNNHADRVPHGQAAHLAFSQQPGLPRNRLNRWNGRHR